MMSYYKHLFLINIIQRWPDLTTFVFPHFDKIGLVRLLTVLQTPLLSWMTHKRSIWLVRSQNVPQFDFFFFTREFVFALLSKALC